MHKFLSDVLASPGFSKIDGASYYYYDSSEEYDDFKIIRADSYLKDKAKSIVNLGKHLTGKGSGGVPIHVAIIPDGNRRWARAKWKMPFFGHYSAASYDRIESLFAQAKELGVKYLSIWGFSTENWKRNSVEIQSIFDLITKGIEHFKLVAKRHKICFKHIGRKDRLPSSLISALDELEEATKKYDEFHVLLLLDYGGRDEIIRAVNKMLSSGIKDVDEESFKLYLDTEEIPDPDLIIRTSGEQRTSGFMPYQSTYAELYFSSKYFPDFSAADLKEAVLQFSGRIRRFGATANEDLKKKK